MRELKVIRSKHQDYERNRRMHFKLLREAIATVSARLEGIIPHRTAAVETVLNDSHPHSRPEQVVFDNTGPEVVKLQPFPRIWNDAPSQRIRINKHLAHMR